MEEALFKLIAFAAGGLLTGAAPALAGPVNPDSGCAQNADNTEGFSLARSVIDVILPPEQGDQMMRQMLGGLRRPDANRLRKI